MLFLRPSAIEIQLCFLKLTQLVDDACCYPGHVLLQPLDAGDYGGEEGLQVGGGQQPALVQHLDTQGIIIMLILFTVWAPGVRNGLQAITVT